MRKNMIIWTGILFLLEFYAYQAFKTICIEKWQRITYWIFTIVPYLTVAYLFLNFNRSENNSLKINIIATIFLAFFLPKILVVLFLLIEDLIRLFSFIFSYLTTKDTTYPSRRKFISLLGLGTAGTLALVFLDGVFFGKFRHHVRKVKIKINPLPRSFKGYKIVQISDVHAGSFQDPSKLQHAIDLINEQNPDLVLFTGDMVNNLSSEFLPFIPLFSQIKSNDGKLAVLGNHDYGSYFYKDKKDQIKNVDELIVNMAKAGFETLRNEHKVISRNNEELYIIGVENWGLPPFPQYGDLDKATKNLPISSAKILMSHDPTHFDEIVKNHPSNIHLTLSGHTHGMQFGLDLKNIKWSPVQYRYPKFMDLYESNGKYLYVNRGFGVIGYPGRVGVNPEITLFELQ